MKKNIAVFVDAFFPYIDGVVNVVDNYYSRLSKDFNITIFVPKYKRLNNKYFSYNVFYVDSYKIPFCKNFVIPKTLLNKNLKNHFKNNKYDLIHVHSPFLLGRYGIKYGHKNNIFQIFTLHSQYKIDFKLIFKFSFIANLLTKTLLINPLKKINVIWNVNKNMEELFKNNYDKKHILKNKIFDIVENATDFYPLDKNLKNEYKKEIFQKYKIDENAFVITYIGRVTKQKNVLTIVESMNELRYQHKNFRCIILGDGNYLKKMHKFIKKYNIEDYFIFTNEITNRNEVLKIICASNIGIFLSYYDTNTLTKFEFASQSVPVLFLKNSITSSNIIDNYNGYLCENDKKNISKKIMEIINSKSYIWCGNNALEDIYQSWDQIAEDVKNKYNQYLNKK